MAQKNMKHINVKSLKRLNFRIYLLGAFIFIIILFGSWLLGEGIYKEIHPNQIAITQRVINDKKAHKSDVSKLKDFHLQNIPSKLQGSYVTYAPVNIPKVDNYYQSATLIHITGHQIVQQYLLVPKKTKDIKMKTIQKNMMLKNKIVQRSTIVQPQLTTIPQPVRNLVKNSHLHPKFNNLVKIDDTGNFSNKKNSYKFNVKTNSALGNYSDNTIKSLIEGSEPCVFTGSNFNKVHLIMNNKGFRCNKYFYHKISTQQVSTLLKLAQQSRPYFDNY